MAKDSYTLGQVNMNAPGVGGRGPGRMKAMEKPGDFKGAWGMLMHYGGRYTAMMGLALASAVASVILSLVGPAKLRTVTNMITSGMEGGFVDTGAVLRIAALLVSLYILSALLAYLRSFLMATFSQLISKNLRTDISAKINRVPLTAFDKASFGDLLSRVTNDVDTIGESLSMSLGDLVTGVTTFALCTAMMLRMNLPLAAVALLASLVGFWAMRTIIVHSQKYFVDRQRYLGELGGHIEEIYAGHTVVKAYGGERQSRREFARLNELLFVSNWKSQFYSGIMMPAMEFVGNLGYLAVCVAGAFMKERGLIDFGTIVAFIVYVKLFTQPLGHVANAATSLQSAAAGSERVFAFLREPEMADETGKLAAGEAANAEVVFDHVKFGYTPGRTIIHDFSVRIAPGQKVAIVGPTGAGKTTLVNLLMRFYELDAGSISIGGVKTTDMTREAVHAMFGMVLQDTWLFEGTVRENIAYSKKGVTDEEIRAACKAVGIDRYILSLPSGYDTVLGDASNMSAGQRQLFTIARTMVADAPLLILDEATSSVDTRTELIVQKAMEKLTEGRTSFTIAHRLSTVRDADVILVMKDGDIVESGSHNELLAKGGFYAELWQSQFVNAEAI
ncbi:MAG TPA: ABC transporter ATP-binding protein [Candidatus Acidoferrum sp.]|nr:ABC transporter ATP-binding protein [Candidatus Acidoferrum sp.]